MPITFRSEAQPSVEMIEKNARDLLDILGKNSADSRGVFSDDQIASAISTLSLLINARTVERKRLAIAEIDEKQGEVFEVDISLRAIPLLQLFELALKSKKPVTWGI